MKKLLGGEGNITTKVVGGGGGVVVIKTVRNLMITTPNSKS
jgi:hypothetical protein